MTERIGPNYKPANVVTVRGPMSTAQAATNDPGITRFLPALACLVVFVALVVSQQIAAPRAMAAMPDCYSTTCEGLDPAQTSCADDAKTIQSSKVRLGSEKGSYGHLEMRYSPSCHSNWVRYTSWSGIRWWINVAIGGSEVTGYPYIWRNGVANSLQGPGGNSGAFALGSPTYWSEMITADGETCSSVELVASIPSQSGYGASDNEELGAFNAKCIK